MITLASTLSNNNQKDWAVFGSCSECLQGCQIVPNDIDVICSAKSFNSVVQSFPSAILKKDENKKPHRIRSSYRKISVAEIEIEIVSCIENYIYGSGWQKLNYFDQQIVEIEEFGVKIKCVKLNDLFDLHLKLGKVERAKKLYPLT